jgi:hypothetical protein
MKLPSLLTVAALLISCGSTSAPLQPSPSPSGRAAVGDTVWVAVLATAETPTQLEPELRAARKVLGESLAPRVMIKESACYPGIDASFEGDVVLAIQDPAEHGVHAMYEAITDDPAFYGPVTLAC